MGADGGVENVVLIKASGTSESRGTTKLSIGRWTPLSPTHIRAAALSTRRLHLCEKDEADRRAKGLSLPTDEFQAILQEHRVHAVVAVIESVAFLEATINEFLAAIAGERVEYSDTVTLSPAVRTRLTVYWKDHIRDNLLKKYQAALELIDVPPFEKVKTPYRGVQGLVKFRDALVHYKPRLMTDDERHDTEKALQDESKVRFVPNPLVPKNDFYPDRVLHHESAKWAVNTSLEFADAFYSKIKAPAPYEAIRSLLVTE